MSLASCQCGAIRFEVRGEPAKVYACHCRECQKQSASAFGISIIHAPEDLTVTRGTPKSWTRATDSGGSLTCWFCDTCGSRLWHAAGDVISIKGGALEVPPTVGTHIWTKRRLPWVVLPKDAETWPGEPEER